MQIVHFTSWGLSKNGSLNNNAWQLMHKLTTTTKKQCLINTVNYLPYPHIRILKKRLSQVKVVISFNISPAALLTKSDFRALLDRKKTLKQSDSGEPRQRNRNTSDN